MPIALIATNDKNAFYLLLHHQYVARRGGMLRIVRYTGIHGNCLEWVYNDCPFWYTAG